MPINLIHTKQNNNKTLILKPTTTPHFYYRYTLYQILNF